MTKFASADILILNLKKRGGEGMRNINNKQLASFKIQCSDCGWDKFVILNREDLTSEQVIRAKCDRCGLGLVARLTKREINFSYEERVTN